MVKKMSLSGVKKPDITPPSVLRERGRIFKIGQNHGRAKWWQVVSVLFGSLVLVGIAAFVLIQLNWATPGLDGSKYQAVFLEDGKVFFGKLKNTDGQYILLESAYYTQSNDSKNAENTLSQTALVKVGSESYGPENNLQIARSKIIFWQNLRDDSQVTTAIKAKESE